MIEYIAEVYKRTESPSENDFWRLLRNYSGGGLSNPLLDDKLLGKSHTISIDSKTPLTLKGLQAEFPNIEITSLEEKSSNPIVINN